MLKPWLKILLVATFATSALAAQACGGSNPCGLYVGGLGGNNLPPDATAAATVPYSQLDQLAKAINLVVWKGTEPVEGMPRVQEAAKALAERLKEYPADRHAQFILGPISLPGKTVSVRADGQRAQVVATAARAEGLAVLVVPASGSSRK